MQRAVILLMLLPWLLLTPPAQSDEARGDYKRSRFDRLTSEVWRYRAPFTPRDLTPVANNIPTRTAQPHRDKPTRLALNADGSKLYVTLQGTENAPGNQLAVVETASRKVLKRINVGSRPYTAVLHPGGRFLVVTNEFSNYASVIDTHSDTVVNTIPLDFYAQDIEFAPDGRRAWVAIRYLDQVLVVDLEEKPDQLQGKVRVVGGFDDDAFFGHAPLSASTANDLKLRGFTEAEIAKARQQSSGGINAILRSRCARCHNDHAGGLITGPDPVENLLSAVENAIGGEPYQSPLLRAVLPKALGGFGDENTTVEFHPGGVLFEEGEPELEQLATWIHQGYGGPGIPVGNEQAHPKDLALYGKYLFVGNTGTMDIAIIDTEQERLIGGIYTGNVASHLLVKDDTLIVLTMGVGFGAPKERDPHGGESWERDNPATQYTVLRDPSQGYDAYPIERQYVMGPFDAVDGTWNFKMRDIQNDLIAIDLKELDLNRAAAAPRPDYLLRVNRYEAHAGWVRYSSDTAEATSGDIKGDIPPELQRVPGAFPEWAALVGDRLYVTMVGSFELVEWQVNTNPEEPSERLVPLRSFNVGVLPVGVAATTEHLFVANRMGETVTVIDTASGASETLGVGDLTTPALATDVERGDVVVHSTVFSADGDVSCAHCHYRDTGDGRGWGAAEVVGQNRWGHLISGGTLGIPQVKNIFAIQPYYFEGTHILAEGQGADINEPASSIDFDRPIWSGDYSQLSSPVPLAERRLMHEELKERVETNKLGPLWYDLDYRRNAFFRDQSQRHFGRSYDLADFYRFVGAWMGNDNRLLPSPFDREHPSVRRGERLFNSAQVMCGVCHTAPEFTNKSRALANNERRALPQLTTMTRRDASYSLASVFAVESANGDPLGIAHSDPGRFEDKEGSFTTMTLRGIFDRPPVFLHHGRARSLREVVLTPRHPGARHYLFPVLMGDEVVRPDRLERGFNELTERTARGGLDPANQIIDSHGGTSHLSPRQVNDLVNFMKVIE